MKKSIGIAIAGLALGCGGGSSSGGSAGGSRRTIVRQTLSSALTGPMQYVPNLAQANVAYVVERAGRVRVLVNDVLVGAPALDITSDVATDGEAGLLGMTLDPDFGTNRFFYLHYVTGGSPLHTRVARYTMNPDMVSASPSGSPVIDISQPYSNHKGGSIHFGPDGFLYMAMGDGGSGNDPENRAQNPQSLLGKMLRIDPDGDAFPGDSVNNYAIPSDNPFVGTAGVRGEIWAFGLRNPFRWSFDVQTGAIVLADVGQSAYEEIDYQPAGRGGRNYGWRIREGRHETGNGGTPYSTDYQDPFLEYSRGDGQSVTGGFVYRGDRFADLDGRFFLADYVSNRLWAAPISLGGAAEARPTTLSSSAEFSVAGGWSGVVSIDPDVNGEPIVTELNAGRVSRLVPAAQE